MRKTDYIQKKPATRKVRYTHGQLSACFLCGSGLEQKNHKSRLKPIKYLQQIVPQSGYGIDIYSKLGELRIANRCTIPEIHEQIVRSYPHIELTERHVENMINTLLLCIAQSGKNATYLKSYFAKRSQKKLQLTIDGVQPEKGHSIGCNPIISMIKIGKSSDEIVPSTC